MPENQEVKDLLRQIQIIGTIPRTSDRTDFKLPAWAGAKASEDFYVLVESAHTIDRAREAIERENRLRWFGRIAPMPFQFVASKPSSKKIADPHDDQVSQFKPIFEKGIINKPEIYKLQAIMTNSDIELQAATETPHVFSTEFAQLVFTEAKKREMKAVIAEDDFESKQAIESIMNRVERDLGQAKAYGSSR